MEDKKCILIVDDDKEIRVFFNRALSGDGYEIICADNGDSAIEILAKGNIVIHLAVIDFMMPHRTGWELIEYIRGKSKYSKIPIIIFTGLLASQEMLEKIKTECFAILQKGDFELESFKKLIREAIRSDEK